MMANILPKLNTLRKLKLDIRTPGGGRLKSEILKQTVEEMRNRGIEVSINH